VISTERKEKREAEERAIKECGGKEKNISSSQSRRDGGARAGERVRQAIQNTAGGWAVKAGDGVAGDIRV
jgi:uncharacterized membrane protein